MGVNTLPSLDKIDPVQAWQPWQPDDRQPWDLKWAGHLYRRAAFGAGLPVLQQAVGRGLPATLELLFNGDPKAKALNLEAWFNNEGARIARKDNGFLLRGWWLYGILYCGHPLLVNRRPSSSAGLVASRHACASASHSRPSGPDPRDRVLDPPGGNAGRAGSRA